MTRYLHIFYISALLVLIPLIRSGFGESCSTSSCHPDMASFSTVHEPVADGECGSCHQQSKIGHPTEQGPDFVLSATGEELCLECHEGFMDRFEHGPAASGACIFCHDPHGSEQKGLLRLPLKSLCLECHEDMASGLQQANYVHSAIEELDCGACHRSHSSQFPRLLKGETSMICFDCHEDIQDKYDRSLSKHEPLYTDGQCANCHQAHYSEHKGLLLWEGDNSCLHCHGSDGSKNNFREKLEKELIHAPIEDEGCAACHDPHGSRYGYILKGAYPQAVYSPYRKGTYGLCFQCHNEELLQEDSSSTGFRNGKVNLHSVHVAREQKGRTCRTCHEVHATDGERLVTAEGAPFGDWRIPVRFEATETGGSCMPGCHRPMQYDSNSPVDNSVKVEAEKNEKE